ncbi:MAG: RNA-binding protein [Nitrospirota bacterium]|nr:RNA-binding protein [Nitrospirota bacterium]MDP3259997.1 RNA-binding protein [Thermodesulfovibrionales bacterium]
MGNRLYVGNISFQASEDDLKELFSKAGTVASTKLITDAATGRPRGFGFVEMSSDEEAQKAIELLNNSSFLDRNIVVNEAKPQGERDRSSRGGPGGPSRERGGFSRERRPGGRR